MNESTVYRLYDAEGALLYIGCSLRFPRRLDDHRRNKAWWPEVSTITIECFGTHDDAMEAEYTAIRTEAPRYNADQSETARKADVTRTQRAAAS
jgi:predicted GIY-YIG superfamily endonuclease